MNDEEKIEKNTDSRQDLRLKVSVPCSVEPVFWTDAYDANKRDCQNIFLEVI
ncbi:hypothetical protein [Methanochimaera problematica]|uniref:hypothetical protein n=1 Tax=Methanochimaera problematica TaxID=2609417 RepID=UPI0029391603|nr:hypothetical protein [Methanoplanus sp. FWC-SCC4]